ncbi:GlsB/YeaQ/YmgE family stress response membrane protein [Prosthecomicrobium pneumaticum]|uniref:Putative membrane protein YeaQ/YmgE (Transglycosylase-associated protein family) n=1 Tax=Prosthecomicrobium pneumaticum TaxID=81895 RepID=A0A7W9FKP2_9HYPH|nr:GlsB/YeaQ/YmgE family stress response membrane protein [Prosthecomicrobium pneumaticum]MBB5751213.1 putative membrane protein YeaQ/YmgE (transglycosylase-associated protein family) [Prosthecomicrobium pneumaticum]
MEAREVLIWIVIGLIAGWLASLVLGGGGLLRYIVTGLIGAIVGGFLFRHLGIDFTLGNSFVDQVVVAAIGAVIVVAIARLIA